MKNLKKLFYPKTIAVIGASENPNKVGGILINKLKQFKGKIIPINLNHQTIFNQKSYPDITKYKSKIDLAIIATPISTVEKILHQCAKKKIKNIIIITAGFSEIGNTKQEEQITKIAQQNKLNILGPNCFGIANPQINLDTTFSNTTPKKGDIAFISQSGALWSYVSDLSYGFSKFVSLGNMSDISFSDLIKYLNKDKKTKKIICYIEKLKHGKDFIKACKKSKKEIYVIKAGKTKTSQKAAISHTGSLATDFNIYKGAFKQAKVTQINSLIEALRKTPQKNKKSKTKFKSPTAIITNAGGAGTLISDMIESTQPDTIKEINDILGTATSKDYEKELKKTKYKKYKNIIIALTPQSMSQPELTAQIISKSPLKKKITAFFLGGKSITKAKEILEKNKIKCYTRI
ncbi:MAG: CoA-binding protein [Candidatus Pacearchaeota archaeon]|nr:CoA-binding protein [Candidatus Pacearchaeota archaeon]